MARPPAGKNTPTQIHYRLGHRSPLDVLSCAYIVLPSVDYSFWLLNIQPPSQQHCWEVTSPLLQIQEPACLICTMETGGVGRSIATRPGQTEVTGLSFCPALRHFVSYCPFPKFPAFLVSPWVTNFLPISSFCLISGNLFLLLTEP